MNKVTLFDDENSRKIDLNELLLSTKNSIVKPLDKILPLLLKLIWKKQNVKVLNTFYSTLHPEQKKIVLHFLSEFQPHGFDEKRQCFGKRVNKSFTKTTREKMNRFFSKNEKECVAPGSGYFDGNFNVWANERNIPINVSKKIELKNQTELGISIQKLPKTIQRRIEFDENKEFIELNELLPELIKFVWKINDIKALNIFYHSLTVSNKKKALIFFQDFLPNKYGPDINDKRRKIFGKRISKDHTEKTKARMERFFSRDKNGFVNPKEGFYDGNFSLWEKHSSNKAKLPEFIVGKKKKKIKKYVIHSEKKLTAKDGGSPTGIPGCKSYRGL